MADAGDRWATLRYVSAIQTNIEGLTDSTLRRAPDGAAAPLTSFRLPPDPPILASLFFFFTEVAVVRVCDLRPLVLLVDNWIPFASPPCPFFFSLSLSLPFFTPLAILVNLVRTLNVQSAHSSSESPR